MIKRNQFPSEFKDKLCMEVCVYQSEHKCSLLEAITQTASNNNISKYTLKAWYYNHGFNSLERQRKLKIAAVTISKKSSFKEQLNTYIKSLSPFKRFLANLIFKDILKQ